MERTCRSSCGLQAGAASGEDEARLLQGCEPARRLSYHLVRFSGFSISSPEDDLEWKGCPRLHARRQSESVDGHQPDGSALVASSSQRQVPAGAGRDVQPVHSRLDHLLQPLLQDAVASDPEEDRCLCHSVGAPQVQADAPSRGHETGSTGYIGRTPSSSPTGHYVMATAEHREPCESRGSCTVLGAPGGETPPGDSTPRPHLPGYSPPAPSA